MKKQFATYEIALKLKELGFNEECFGYYHINEGYTKGYAFCYSENTRTSDCSVLAPLWQQVIDWFREKHGIIISPAYDHIRGNGNYLVWFYNIKTKYSDLWDLEYKSYEEAREQAILKAIELC